MKACVILYHKNITKIYKTEWIEKCINSILDQTYQDFYIYELNYGFDKINFSIYLEKLGNRYKFFNEDLPNHGYAMNYLLDRCLEDDFDVVFNVNLDDYYHIDRFEKQIEKIQQGYDIVSSNIQYVNNNKLESIMEFSSYNGRIESRIFLENIIAHPTVCYSKRFIKEIRYNPSEIPLEDYNLWKRIYKDYKIYIIDKVLCYYRIHSNQIGSVNKTIKETKQSEFQLNFTPPKNILLCKCGGQVDELSSPSGNRYKICSKCKRIF